MPQENISEYLDPSRFPRMAFGLKANSTLNRITLTPSNANPGETLYIEIPKLSENMVIVPGSVFLLFNLTLSGHENNTVVNNISRSLVKRQRVVFGGESLQDTMNYDLFQTYHETLKSEGLSREPTSEAELRAEPREAPSVQKSEWFDNNLFFLATKMSEQNKLVKMVTDSAVLVGVSAGVGYLAKKILKENFLGDPSSNVMNYAKFTGVLCTVTWLKTIILSCLAKTTLEE